MVCFYWKLTTHKKKDTMTQRLRKQSCKYVRFTAGRCIVFLYCGQEVSFKSRYFTQDVAQKSLRVLMIMNMYPFWTQRNILFLNML